MSKERLMQIIQEYISNDLNTYEYGYVLEVLRDDCGCTDDEIRELGFGFLLAVG